MKCCNLDLYKWDSMLNDKLNWRSWVRTRHMQRSESGKRFLRMWFPPQNQFCTGTNKIKIYCQYGNRVRHPEWSWELKQQIQDENIFMFWTWKHFHVFNKVQDKHFIAYLGSKKELEAYELKIIKKKALGLFVGHRNSIPKCNHR